MRKSFIILLLAFFVSAAYAQKSGEGLPAGAIHHFDFNGNLKDAVTGTPLMKIGLEWKDTIRKVSSQHSTTKLKESDVTWVADDGEKTAIRMLPMEFASDLSTLTKPQLTVSMRVRLNKSDIDGNHAEEDGSFVRSANKLTLFEPVRFTEGSVRCPTRTISADVLESGDVRVEYSSLSDKTTLPADEWTWITITNDCHSDVKMIYVGENKMEAVNDTTYLDSLNRCSAVRMCYVSRSRSIERCDLSEIIVWDRVLTPEEVAKVHGIDGFSEVTIYDRFGLLINIAIGLALLSLLILILRPLHFSHYKRTNGLGHDAEAAQAITEAENLFFSSSAGTRIYPWPLTFLKIHSRIRKAIKAEPNDEALKERLNSLITDHNACMKYRYSGSGYVILAILLAVVIYTLCDWFTSGHIMWKSVVDQFIPLFIALFAYIIVSFGWSFASLHGKPLEKSGKESLSWGDTIAATGSVAAAIGVMALALVRICLSLLGEGLASSTQLAKVYVNGVFQGITQLSNPAGLAGSLLMIGLILGVLFLVCYFLSVIMILVAFIIVPVKFIRVHILHI